ncbi:hypothetical protein PIB30_115181, partial [Stylosanthes scabra]|nr:hypothetical protein [Stylosanthes scabra]
TIQAKDCVSRNLCDINWNVQRFYYPTISIGKTVFDVVQCCINENTIIIPGSTLYTDRLMESTLVHKFLAGNYNGMFAEQSNMLHVIGPDNIFDERCLKFTKNNSLLKIKYYNPIL